MANFKKNTRYTNGQLAKNRSGQQFIVLRKPLILDEDEGDVFVTIGKDLQYRPDLISNKAYGTPDLWWAIFEFNGISDPLFGLRIGQILRIPELNRLLRAIELLGTE